MNIKSIIQIILILMLIATPIIGSMYSILNSIDSSKTDSKKPNIEIATLPIIPELSKKPLVESSEESPNLEKKEFLRLEDYIREYKRIRLESPNSVVEDEMLTDLDREFIDKDVTFSGSLKDIKILYNKKYSYVLELEAENTAFSVDCLFTERDPVFSELSRGDEIRIHGKFIRHFIDFTVINCKIEKIN